MALPKWIKTIACAVLSKKQKIKLICMKIDSKSEYEINHILKNEAGFKGWVASVFLSSSDKKYEIKKKIRAMSKYELDNLIKYYG